MTYKQSRHYSPSLLGARIQDLTGWACLVIPVCLVPASAAFVLCAHWITAQLEPEAFSSEDETAFAIVFALGMGCVAFASITISLAQALLKRFRIVLVRQEAETPPN